jgi:deoxycytidine triphosphate deaminase
MNKSLILSDSEIAHYCASPAGSNQDPLIEPYLRAHANSGTYLLTVGGVYTPSTPGEQGSRDKADGVTLAPGMMAIVVSHEQLSIPPELLGIVFGINRLTREGLLLVNPGVITTGHTREISFTVINFGRKPVDLIKNTAIARVFFLLTDSSNVANPGNLGSDAYRDALNDARQALHADFSGHLKEFLAKPYRELITDLWMNVGLGVVGFGVILSLIAILSPMIAERASQVPRLQRRVDSLHVQITETNENLRLLRDSIAVGDTTAVGTQGTGARASSRESGR